jgi:hypothetical protein
VEWTKLISAEGASFQKHKPQPDPSSFWQVT